MFNSRIRATVSGKVRLNRLLVAFMCFYCLLGPACQSVDARVLELEPAIEEMDLQPYISVYEDPTGTTQIEQILALPNDNYVSLEDLNSDTAMGYSNSAFWVRFDIQNPTVSHLERYIEYEQSWTADVIFYCLHDHEIVTEYQAGTTRPFHLRPIDSRYFVFPAELQQGSNTCYIRIQSAEPVNLDFRLWQPGSYGEHEASSRVSFLILYGALGILIILNIFVFLVNRDRATIYFVLFMTGFLFFLLSFDGTGFQYLWPDNTWWESRSLTETAIGYNIFGILFFVVFVDLRRHHKPLYLTCCTIAGIGGVVVLAKLVLPGQFMIPYLYPLLLFWFACLSVTCLWLWFRKGERSALFFLGSQFVFIIASILNALQALGFIQYSDIIHNGMHTGAIIVALVLNMGLADRINQYTRALQNADLQLRTQYDDLQQVHTELRSAMEQSAALNEELIASQEELIYAHEQLQAQERRISTIFDLAPLAMAILDRNGTILDANQMSAKIFNHSIEELIGMSVGEFMQETEFQDALAKMYQIFKGSIKSYIVERQYVHGNGAMSWGETHVAALLDEDGQATAVIVTINDTTQRRAAEEALKESEERLRLSLEATSDALWDYNVESSRMYFSPRYYTMLNYEPGDFVPAYYSWESLLHDEDLAQARMLMQSLINNESPDFFLEYRMRCKDGSYRWILGRGKAVDRDANHRATRITGTHVDIHKRKEAEEEMKKLQMLLTVFFDSMPSMLVGIGADGRINLWNQAAAAVTGLEQRQALGQLAADIVPQIDDYARFIDLAINEHSVQTLPKMQWKSGEETGFTDILIYPLNTEDLKGVVVRIDDITEKVRLEEMIVQTEKMLSVGGLAAGMAHEINNPLGGILQGTQNIKRRLSLELEKNRTVAAECSTTIENINEYVRKRQILELLEGIRDSGARAAQIVSNMLQFSRLSQSHKEPCSLPELIERTLKLAASDYDLERRYDFKHIEIKREFDPDVPEIFCIGTEIEQVILNLLMNAAQAVFSHSKHPEITIRISREDDWAVMSVQDNGPGMDQTTLRRVFEPFYTTKDPGSGTGLGLSVSYFIITNNHNGQMFVESVPGQGARFTVQLPVQ